MPIKVAAAPRSALKLLQAGIEEYLSSGLVDPKLIDAKLADAKLEQIVGHTALYRVFNLGLDALVAGRPLAEAAKQIGWRAELLDNNKHTVAAAELVITRAGLRFSDVSFKPDSEVSEDSNTVVERWSHEVKGDHEFSLLRIPGAYCSLYWLRSNDGTADQFVPIAPCPKSLTRGKIYSESELRAALRPQALKQLAFAPAATKRRSQQRAVKKHSRRRASKPAKAKRRSRQRR